MSCNNNFNAIVAGTIAIADLSTTQVAVMWECLSNEERGLLSIIATSQSGGGGGGGTTYTTSNSDATLLQTSASGSTTAGVMEYSIVNIGTADGVVDGDVFPIAASFTSRGYIDEVAKEVKRLGSIAYDASGTLFLVSELP